MLWPFHNKTEARYWLKVFAYYALAEGAVQLIFFFIFNTFTSGEGSNIEYHLLMVVFHCILIWPIWLVARSVRKQRVAVQIAVNLAVALLYGYAWLIPVQDIFGSAYNAVLDITQPGTKHTGSTIDSKLHYSIINFQILKHAFRLSFFYLAQYFYNYKWEEKKRIELVVSNKELELKLLKWHLNPSFYFRTIKLLQKSASQQPHHASNAILQLAKVMEYVIYEASQPRVEMKRELEFLNNYVQLMNHQADDDKIIILEYKEVTGKFKIAPLLLAGYVDNIMSTGNKGMHTSYKLNIHITDNELVMQVHGLQQSPGTPALLEELYSGRYTTDYSSEKGYRLSLRLDAA